VYWDDLCPVPFVGLHKLLVPYAENKPAEGLDEIERLIDCYPSQRMQALHAKVVLLARVAGKLTDLTELDEIVADLPVGNQGFLTQTTQVREWLLDIIQVQARLNTTDRPFFRESYAQILREKVDNFRHQTSGFHQAPMIEFRTAANQWLQISERQLADARNITTKVATPQVFRAGDPVNRDQEAFVGRNSVVGELEQQIMLSTGCPGIVLFGRRRVGKTSILRNLNGFLPANVITAFVSMQNPDGFTTVESAVGLIIGEIHNRMHFIDGAADSTNDLSGLFHFLTDCNTKLESAGKRLLLAVDEYEMIDKKIGEGVFNTDLLDTIRESIQTHRCITWIFAGSHEITELRQAAWTSYLVSARTVEVPIFTLDETRLLLTEPLKHSTLWKADDSKRPRFAASFWGEGGIERIHDEAGGWPHLIQLIAEMIVDLINDRVSNKVSTSLLEQALDKSIVRGHTVLYELMHAESLLPGEWEYISAFRKTETQKPPYDDQVAASLKRRSLIAEQNGEWKLRVPLMARWLRKRG
jgi:hypothetical protein